MRAKISTKPILRCINNNKHEGRNVFTGPNGKSSWESLLDIFYLGGIGGVHPKGAEWAIIVLRKNVGETDSSSSETFITSYTRLPLVRCPPVDASLLPWTLVMGAESRPPLLFDFDTRTQSAHVLPRDVSEPPSLHFLSFCGTFSFFWAPGCGIWSSIAPVGIRISHITICRGKCVEATKLSGSSFEVVGVLRTLAEWINEGEE